MRNASIKASRFEDRNKDRTFAAGSHPACLPAPSFLHLDSNDNESKLVFYRRILPRSNAFHSKCVSARASGARSKGPREIPPKTTVT